MSSTHARSSNTLFADLLFITGAILLLLFFQELCRGLLWLRNQDLATGANTEDILMAFAVGLRFDLIITCITSLPLVLALLSRRGLGKRIWARSWLIFSGSLIIFLGISELDFYHEFHTRLNSLAIQYLKEDPATVGSMLWHGFPIIRYLLLWLALSLSYIWLLQRIHKFTSKPASGSARWWLRMPVFLVVAFLVAWGARGTLRQGPPLRWGDAFHSQSLFANHLALNGVWTLAKAAIGDAKKDAGKRWLKTMPQQEAVAQARKLLLTSSDQLLLPDQYTVLRQHQPKHRLHTPPQNIVFIIMESFSGQVTGALGHDIGITPEFDKLARQGLLFDHFFSNGTHTHQGMFASVACFPNLPGFEYLMQSPEGQHQFSGLPVLLKPRGFQDVYVYNGDFAWDNQKGFFRNQGMTRFIGRNAIENPVLRDPTWGVSDQDMFNQAIREIDRLDPEQPFFAVLQTLSNHTPYALPDPLPTPEITGFGDLNKHLTAQHYADWALGRFFDQARQKSWYQKTLFVLVGDHAFGVKQQLTPIDLLRFHVPMLLIAPGIQESYGKVRHTVGTQVDLVPTAVSLLGPSFTHQCWGRDLLALDDGDPGFGIIKPSGSNYTVAYLRGNHIMIKPPHGKAEYGRYQLDPKPTYQPDQLSETEYKQKLKTLQGYISAAMNALLNNTSGVPNLQH